MNDPWVISEWMALWAARAGRCRTSNVASGALNASSRARRGSGCWARSMPIAWTLPRRLPSVRRYRKMPNVRRLSAGLGGGGAPAESNVEFSKKDLYILENSTLDWAEGGVTPATL